jgi:hypothetical protein
MNHPNPHLNAIFQDLNDLNREDREEILGTIMSSISDYVKCFGVDVNRINTIAGKTSCDVFSLPQGLKMDMAVACFIDTSGQPIEICNKKDLKSLTLCVEVPAEEDGDNIVRVMYRPMSMVEVVQRRFFPVKVVNAAAFQKLSVEEQRTAAENIMASEFVTDATREEISIKLSKFPQILTFTNNGSVSPNAYKLVK